MKITKRGNGRAIRIPADVTRALDLAEGDEIEIEVTGRREFRVRKTPDARMLVERLRKFRGRLPAEFRFDRQAASRHGGAC